MQQKEESLINFDFGTIERMDPCLGIVLNSILLEGGYIIVMDQQIPFLVRFIE